MNNNNEIILSLIEDILGSHRITRKDNPQKYFNCKSNVCKNDKNKYNLSYHADSKIFKCWKCKQQGFVSELFYLYGTKEQNEKLKLILPFLGKKKQDFFKKNDYEYDQLICQLPKEYIPLYIPKNTFKFEKALEYVTQQRKLSLDEIYKYKIGYTEEGPKKLRIIIPSFNKHGKINYYEARTYWNQIKQTYIKPDYPEKDDIIFNEKYINYDLPIFLVEGFFDAVRIPNSIPMLGKIPSSRLISKLIEHKCKVILCLDEDALKDCYDITNLLSSLGLDVYYVDMTGYDDISKTYEQKGPDAIIKLLTNIKKLHFKTFLKNLIKYDE